MDTTTLGIPVANWPSDGCSVNQFFEPQELIFDITLCGGMQGRQRLNLVVLILSFPTARLRRESFYFFTDVHRQLLRRLCCWAAIDLRQCIFRSAVCPRLWTARRAYHSVFRCLWLSGFCGAIHYVHKHRHRHCSHLIIVTCPRSLRKALGWHSEGSKPRQGWTYGL